MKIHYLSNSPLHLKPANAVHVMSMCSAFAQHGHKVVLHAQTLEYNIDYFSVYGVPKIFKLSLIRSSKVKYLGPVLYAYKQVSGIRDTGFLCYARCPFSAYFALQKGFKVVFEVHEIPHSYFISLLYKLIFKAKDLIRVVCISEGLLSDLKKKYTFSSTALVAHDGANLPVLIKDPSCSTFFDNNANKTVIGYAGGLRAGNGIELILNLAKQNPKLLFAFAGGSEEEIKQWKKIHDLENVIWLGKLEPKQVAGFLQQCSILMAPYQPGPKTGAGRDTGRWMSPLKLFEYMAAKKPIMLSDFPVLREVVSEQEVKLLPPDDLDSWHIALNELNENKKLAVQLADNAYQVLVNNYTWVYRAKLVLDGILL